MNSRSERALRRAIEEAQERHVRIWNAQIKRMEDAERKAAKAAKAADAKRRATLRSVK